MEAGAVSLTPIVTASIDPRRIPGLRKQLKLSQADMARKIGVAPQELCRLESALRPGGMLDRLIEAITEEAAKAAA